ncbi:hypothetical protein [Terrabacter lapilli]|uniref:hypothetical protein n=1 Tax=Terrabacter lapilli TaxID=436231 RepID=UPI0031CE964D
MHEPTAPVPGDLPDYRGEPPASVLASAERAEWVPQAVAPRPAPTPDDVPGPPTVPVGLRVRRWHLVAAGSVVVLALTGIAVIAVGHEPAGRADALPTNARSRPGRPGGHRPSSGARVPRSSPGSPTPRTCRDSRDSRCFPAFRGCPGCSR